MRAIDWGCQRVTPRCFQGPGRNGHGTTRISLFAPWNYPAVRRHTPGIRYSGPRSPSPPPPPMSQRRRGQGGRFRGLRDFTAQRGEQAFDFNFIQGQLVLTRGPAARGILGSIHLNRSGISKATVYRPWLTRPFGAPPPAQRGDFGDNAHVAGIDSRRIRLCQSGAQALPASVVQMVWRVHAANRKACSAGTIPPTRSRAICDCPQCKFRPSSKSKLSPIRSGHHAYPIIVEFKILAGTFSACFAVLKPLAGRFGC